MKKTAIHSRYNTDRPRQQWGFIARGLAARDDARRRGVYVGAAVVIGRLEQMLAEAKSKK